MIRRLFLPRRFALVRRAAFTLIELLTVIAIILILAGLLLHIAGNAQYKSSTARAQSEIKAMETALEGYKADNGSYPRPSPAGSSSDKLNAQSANDLDPSGADSAVYQAAGQLLYQALSGYTPNSSTYNKRYMELRPGQLSTGSAAVTKDTYVIDPFGLPYGYSTANAYAQEQASNAAPGATPSSTPATNVGYNPTFDLWSTAGYAAIGGKPYSKSGLDTPAYNTLWVKNW